jgi:hypothetical protein
MEIMKMNMKHNNARNTWRDQNAKLAFVEQQATDLLNALVASGATFYSYCGQEIMYLNRWVTDVFRKEELLSALRWHLNVIDLPYAHDTLVSVRRQARALYKPTPEGTLGKVNGVKEPKLKMTKYLSMPIRTWIREVIESGILQ